MVAQSRPTFTSLVQAALALAALPVLGGLGLACPTASAVIAALGVGHTRAYELRNRLLDAAKAIQQPTGRPPKSPDIPAPDASLAVTRAVLDYLLDHPGSAIAGKQRATYTGDFRCFVIGLLAPGSPGEALTLEQAAAATRVPRETLKSWLAAPKPPAEPEPEPELSDANDASALVPDGQLAQILDLYDKWNGGFIPFLRALRKHRIYITAHTLRALLQLAGKRKPRRRNRKDNDSEALRGQMERFFPNAQAVADGKAVDVWIGSTPFCFNWELLVDVYSNALTGLVVSDHEDAQGLLDALEHHIETTHGPPEALLRDNKPSNFAPEVETALEQADTISMPSTTGRPENKAPVEGTFGLFEQQMPDIILPEDASPRQLARAVLWYVLFAYAAGRNQAPRPNLDGRPPAQAFQQDAPTHQEREQARQRLLDIRNRVLQQREAERAATDPVCRRILEQAFEELGLHDPENTFIPAIARYGLDTSLEAVAILKAKRKAGRPPGDFDERYLRGIAQHVAERREDDAVYAELVRLRERSGDILLDPLRRLDATLRSSLSLTDYLDACFTRSIDSDFLVDRHFWRQAFLAAFGDLDPDSRRIHGPWFARKIASQYDLPATERDSFIAELAETTIVFA
jgi:hypothetical protein